MLARLFSKFIGRGDREAGPRGDREAAPQVRIVITGGQISDREALRDFERAGLGTFL